jgi:hypothetical protein
MMGGTSMMPITAGTSSLATAMTGFMGSNKNVSGLTAVDMATLIQKLTISSGQI